MTKSHDNNQGSLFPETDPTVTPPVDLDEYASHIAAYAHPDPYAAQRERQDRIIDLREGSNTVSGLDNSDNPDENRTESGDDTPEESRINNQPIETPSRGRTNFQTWMSAEESRELTKHVAAMSPEDRASREETSLSGIRAAREALTQSTGVPDAESQVVSPNLKSKNSIGRVVSTKYFDINPNDLGESSEDLRELLDIGSLRSFLFNKTAEFNVAGLVLKPDEYVAIVRNTDSFGRAVIARTLRAREQDSDLSRRNDTADRSEVHALSSKADTISDMLTGLVQEQNWLARFNKEIRSLGYAHQTEATMRIWATNAWQISFKGILDVVAKQLDYDKDQYHELNQALTRRLLTGPQSQKIKYWGELTRLSMDYNRAKRALCRNRLAQIRRVVN